MARLLISKNNGAQLIGLMLLIGLTVSGCNLNIAKEIRRHTYPPEFNYTTEKELKTTMWQLAAQVKKLEEVMQNPNVNGDLRRREAMQILTEMEQISKALGMEGWPGNHPKVSRNITKFRSDLVAARRALETNPPVYYLAGTISGACSHCHGAS